MAPAFGVKLCRADPINLRVPVPALTAESPLKSALPVTLSVVELKSSVPIAPMLIIASTVSADVVPRLMTPLLIINIPALSALDCTVTELDDLLIMILGCFTFILGVKFCAAVPVNSRKPVLMFMPMRDVNPFAVAAVWSVQSVPKLIKPLESPII